MALTLLLGSFLLLLLAGIPIAFCFLIASLLYLWFTGFPLSLTAQMLSGGVRSFTLMAVPLYILAGELMNVSGITKRIFDFALSVIGHLKGGLGHVNVLASMIFAGISGSSSADAAGLGRIEIQAMIEKGYKPEFAASITAVSSTIGPIIPPSIHLVLYGALAEVRVDHLFLAGIIPGVIMGLLLMLAIYLRAASGKDECPTQPWLGMKNVWATLKRAFFPLLAPIIIVGGILTGVVTPTEAGVVAVIYALVLGFVYGDLRSGGVYTAFSRAVRSTAVVMFILATSKVFAWGITIEKVPDILASAMLSLTDNKLILLLLINIGLLVLGMFESASANLVIVTPILVPIAIALGIDLVHLGVIIVLALMIGIITPPVGISLFIVSDISKVPFDRIVKVSIPYVASLIAALFIVTYFPDVVLFIPKLFGYTP